MIAGRVRGGPPSRRQDDAGSATVWVLATGMLLVLAAGAMAMAGAATLARHRAQAAADLAALAGALRASEGEPAACQRAADVSARNGALLVECRLEGLDVVVAVEVKSAARGGFGVARGAARAGPIEAREGSWVRVSKDGLVVRQRSAGLVAVHRAATHHLHL